MKLQVQSGITCSGMFCEVLVTQQCQILAEALSAGSWFQQKIEQKYWNLNKLRKLCIASGEVQCNLCLKLNRKCSIVN